MRNKTGSQAKQIHKHGKNRAELNKFDFGDNLAPLPGSFDPELLYIECGRCGAPVIWEPGKATSLLKHAGIDPFELDACCMLVTDACPVCSKSDEYSVRIFRITDREHADLLPRHGNA